MSPMPGCWLVPPGGGGCGWRAPPRRPSMCPPPRTGSTLSPCGSKVPTRRSSQKGSLTAEGCGLGLPARFFFEMEGVFMSSRFFLENMVRPAEQPGRAEQPGSGRSSGAEPRTHSHRHPLPSCQAHVTARPSPTGKASGGGDADPPPPPGLSLSLRRVGSKEGSPPRPAPGPAPAPLWGALPGHWAGRPLLAWRAPGSTG